MAAEFQSQYISKKPDAQGYVEYTAAEHDVWNRLYHRQMQIMPGRACNEHLQGLELLGLSADNIPQLPDVNKRLSAITGWQVHAVDALISATEFFHLLKDRKFPAATFIRTLEELNYVKEPDIFHELFGHCPILTNQIYADFVQAYAEMVLRLPEKEWPLLQRLFWFTVEFGLINTADGLRAYGGGILSSIEETVYSVESDMPQRKPFDILEAFRTPYRIDMLQAVYFVIDSYQQLYDIANSDIEGLLAKAHQLGEYPPTFKVELDNPNFHIFCC